MVRPVKRDGAARIGAAAASPVIRCGVIARRVIGVSELVVLALGDPAERDLQPSPTAEPLARQADAEVLVKQPVVPQLVGGDAAADFLQHRLVGRFAQRDVVRAGAGLDNAARDHLARA